MYCKTCGKEIRDQAEICPHCGVRVKSEVIGKEPRKKWVAIVLAGCGLTHWTYLYTYKEDAIKFWMFMFINFFGMFFALIPNVFVYFIILLDVCLRDNKWYEQYWERNK